MGVSKAIGFFGFGYVAAALWDALQPKGFAGFATARSEEKWEENKKEEVFPLTGEVLEGVSHVLISAPPSSGGCPIFSRYKERIKKPLWVGYLSTTAVYGDHKGGWVSEATPPAPCSERGENRLLAEEQWRGFGEERGVDVFCFRLPGIYGPFRNVLSKLKRGEAKCVEKEGQVFSRIHVRDIARALVASMGAGKPCVYNLADDEPCAPHMVTQYGAELLSMDAPPLVSFEGAGLSAMAKSFYAENKRVSNVLMKERLVKPLYPTYKEGLQAIFEAGAF